MDSERSCMHQGEMTKWKPLMVTILVVPGDRMMVEGTDKAENGTSIAKRSIRGMKEYYDGKTKKGSESENFGDHHILSSENNFTRALLPLVRT